MTLQQDQAQSSVNTSTGTRTDSPSSSGGSGQKLRRLLIVVLVTVIVAIIVAWGLGLLRPTPRVVVITSTEDAYWDRVIAGAEAAGKEFNVRVSVVRSKGDEKSQSQIVRDAL